MPQLISVPAGSPAGSFLKFVQFSAMVEKKDAKPTVYGIATWEKADSDNEICDYDTAVPVYQAWSKKAIERTRGAGQDISHGNIRLMHGAEVGGKVTSIDFRDDAREIAVGSEPVDDAVYQQLKGGYLTGYSQGGSYGWRECEECKAAMPLQQGMNWCVNCEKLVPVRYGLKRLAEISYVDSPAIGEGFEHVKAGGSRGIIKFRKSKEAAVAKTKMVAGVALPAKSFAYVGDPEKTATWKLPIEFPGDEEKSKRHIRNALARIDQAKGIPSDKIEAVRARIHAAAKEHGIDVAEEQKAEQAKHAKVMAILKARIDELAPARGLEKGLYAVSAYARLLEDLSYLWEQACWEREVEGDDSEIPDELRDQLEQMVETFIAMAEEEARELAAITTNKKGESSTMEKTAEQLELEKAAKKSLVSHFAKTAAHHEKMAAMHDSLAEDHDEAGDHHEKAMKACQDCMGKATKADVGSDDAAQPVHEILANQVEFHKAMAGCEADKADGHEKLSSLHEKMAAHYTKMAESHDESADKADTAAILKAAREEAYPVSDRAAKRAAAKAAAPAPVAPTMSADVDKAEAALRETPEYKDSIKSIAQAKVDAEVEALRKSTLAPTGVEIIDGDKAAKAASGALTAVRRGGAEPDVELVSASERRIPGTL